MKSIIMALVIGFLFASLISQGLSVCDDSTNEAILDVCYKLDQQVEDVLLQDKGNLYRLRKAFFYAPNAHPVLLRVIYNLSYAENATQEDAYCTNSTNADNQISLNKSKIVLGWTSSGVFTVFHPLTINFMQIQVPFVLMKMFYSLFKIIHPNESGPEADTFLWDGSYDLPTLHLNLYFTSLPCIPNTDTFNAVLRDFNSLLRVYAGKDITGIIQDSGNTRLVGFSLPSSSVSPYDIRAKSDFLLYIFYVISTVALYTSCVTTIFFVVSKSETKGIKLFTKRNPEVLIAIIMVIGTFILVEICAEFVMAIIWTVSVKDRFVGFTVFVAALVYYGPGVVSLYKVGRKCHLYYRGQYNKRENTTVFDKTKDALDNGAKVDALFKCFVWITAYFAYVLLYSFFPAFVLAFAYPTRVITIFAFIATFLVLSIVYLTTYIKKGVTLKACKDIKFMKIIFCIILMILLIYFFLFVFALLYALVIGRASVVSSAPLAVLSLLPSILISIAAWVMKSTMLNNGCDGKNENRDKSDDENQDGENEIDAQVTKSKENEADQDAEVIANIKQPKEIEVDQDGEVIANNLPLDEENCSCEETELIKELTEKA